MKCLVTGAAGYIGYNLTKRLLSEGYEVKALIHKNQPPSLIKNEKIDYISGDVTDKKSLTTALKDVSVVFHCAAITKDYGKKKLFYDVNYQGTKNLVEASRNEGVKKFIYLSTIRVLAKKPVGHYIKTKLRSEEFLINYSKKNHFPIIIIRPGDVYGPGNTIWVKIIIQAIKNKRIALINKGNGIFHHVYIDNLLDALILCIKKTNLNIESFVITDGDNEITWKKYINQLAKIIGKEPIKKNISKKVAIILAFISLGIYKITAIKPILTPLAVEIFTNQQHFSIKKAEKKLGYHPEIAYNQGMKEVEKWLKNQYRK